MIEGVLVEVNGAVVRRVAAGGAGGGVTSSVDYPATPEETAEFWAAHGELGKVQTAHAEEQAKLAATSAQEEAARVAAAAPAAAPSDAAQSPEAAAETARLAGQPAPPKP